MKEVFKDVYMTVGPRPTRIRSALAGIRLFKHQFANAQTFRDRLNVLISTNGDIRGLFGDWLDLFRLSWACEERFGKRLANRAKEYARLVAAAFVQHGVSVQLFQLFEMYAMKDDDETESEGADSESDSESDDSESASGEAMDAAIRRARGE